jgi:hypothetical protein
VVVAAEQKDPLKPTLQRFLQEHQVVQEFLLLDIQEVR